jgi:hypothetical protein
MVERYLKIKDQERSKVTTYSTQQILYYKMSLAPTHFVAENVTVFVKYAINNKPKWCFGYVIKVIEHGVQDGHHYVDAEVQYDDEDETTCETLWDYDYEVDTEDAWRFTNEYKPLVNQVTNILEEQAIEAELDELDQLDQLDQDEDTEDDTETDYDEDDTEDEDTDDEDDIEYTPQRRSPSFINQFFATLWTFSPLIATFIVTYNARDDIARALRNKYC